MAVMAKLTFLCLAFFATLLFASASESGRTWEQDYLLATQKFPGIAFNELFGSCGKTKGQWVIEATRVAVDDMLHEALHGKIDNNADWNRFFMNDGEADGNHGWTRNGDVSQ